MDRCARLLLFSMLCLFNRTWSQAVPSDDFTDGTLPVIQEISTGVSTIGIITNYRILNKSKDFFVVGTSNENPSTANRLICTASGSDQVSWQYKRDRHDSWTDGPGVMEIAEIISNFKNGRDLLGQEILHRGVTGAKDLLDPTGYYRCVAENTARQSKAHSPPIKFVIPVFVDEVMGKDNKPVYNFGNNPKHLNLSSNKDQPLVVPCFDPPRHLYSNTPQIDVKSSQYRFSWKKENVALSSLIENPSRVTIDPKNGDLYFAYVMIEDEEHLHCRRCSHQLTCQSRTGWSRFALGVRFNSFKVRENNLPIPDFTVLTPPSEEVAGQKVVKEEFRPVCFSQRLCEITVIFGGRLAVVGKVLGLDPNNTELLDDEFPGLRFIPPISEKLERYTAKLVNVSDINEVFETLYIDVIIHNLPILVNQSNFPKIQYIEEGQSVELSCQTLYTNKNATFYYNGEPIVAGDPNFVSFINGDYLKTRMLNRNDSCVIECENDNEAGIFYASSVLEIVVPLKWTTSYTTDNVSLGNDSPTIELNCSITLDAKATDAEVYWMYQIPGLPPMDATYNSAGVKTLIQKPYNSQSLTAASMVELKATPEAPKLATWWCKAHYTYGREISQTEDGKQIKVFVESLYSEQKSTTISTTATVQSTTTTPTTKSVPSTTTSNHAKAATTSLSGTRLTQTTNGLDTMTTIFTTKAQVNVSTQSETFQPVEILKLTTQAIKASTSLENTPNTSTTAQTKFERAEQAKKAKKKKQTPLIIIGVIVAIAIAVGLGAAFYIKEKSNKTEKNLETDMEKPAELAESETMEKKKEDPPTVDENMPQVEVTSPEDTQTPMVASNGPSNSQLKSTEQQELKSPSKLGVPDKSKLSQHSANLKPDQKNSGANSQSKHSSLSSKGSKRSSSSIKSKKQR